MSSHPSDEEIRLALFTLLDARACGATVCPSEVARRLSADASGWRPLMPRVRAVAAQLAAQGAVRITRHGMEVDSLAGGGPIRIGRRVHGAST